MVFHLRGKPVSRADSGKGAVAKEDGSGKRRSMGDGLVDRLSRLSKDMVESVLVGFACGPKIPAGRRTQKRADWVTSPGRHSHVSDDEFTIKHNPRPSKGAGRFSLDSKHLHHHRRTWRSVHGSLQEWKGFALKKIKYKFEELVIGDMVGKGEHGTVHIGRAGTHIVAIKIAVNIQKSMKEFRDYAPPEGMFTGVRHPNLVQVYGVHTVEKDMEEGMDCSSPDSQQSLGSDIFSSRTGYMETPRAHCRTSKCIETYVVMEYCDKGDLWNAVKLGKFHLGVNHSFPNFRMILEVALEVAYGMQHLHELGIIHGDLKAKNVLLFGSSSSRKKFIAKISDFGRSRKPEDGRQDLTTYSSGTVDHMAPETLRDGKLHHATDVFSFSILLYEMITKKHPFGSMAPTAILVAIVEGMRPKIPYTCPVEIANLMRSCWHHNWQCRPSFSIIVARLINIMT